MLTHPRALNRVLALGAVLTLAFGAASCGGSDDEGGDGAETTPAVTTAKGGAAQTEEQRARATIDRLYQGHRDTDPAAVCAELSDPAQQQVIQGDLGGKGVTCEESFEKFFEGSEGSDQQRAVLTVKVGKIKIKGNHAVASVRFRTGPGEIPLVKIDGDWKLDAVGAAQPAS
jgi:hypothetical protein